MITAEYDSLIRLKDVQKCAAKIPLVKEVLLPVGHFDIYTGDWSTKVSATDAEFLAEQLRKSCNTGKDRRGTVSVLYG